MSQAPNIIPSPSATAQWGWLDCDRTGHARHCVQEDQIQRHQKTCLYVKLARWINAGQSEEQITQKLLKILHDTVQRELLQPHLSDALLVFYLDDRISSSHRRILEARIHTDRTLSARVQELSARALF